jgi:hypothetical protein
LCVLAVALSVVSAPTVDYSLALSLYADLPIVLTIVYFDGTSTLSLHTTYQKTYKHFLLPFSIKNLASTSKFLPLVFKNQYGRPTTKQIQKGAWKCKGKKCSKCYRKGYNIQKCWFAPAINRQQQRTQEQDISIDSSDLSNSSSSNLDSNIDEEALIDQIEFNLHCKRIARA